MYVCVRSTPKSISSQMMPGQLLLKIPKNPRFVEGYMSYLPSVRVIVIVAHGKERQKCVAHNSLDSDEAKGKNKNNIIVCKRVVPIIEKT